MQWLSATVRKLLRGLDGASMVEYGLLLAFIAVVTVSVISSVGGIVKTLLDVSSSL
jgi:Flp pilus assembly pilin Flp